MRIALDILPFACVAALGLLVSQFFRVGLIACASLVVAVMGIVIGAQSGMAASQIVARVVCLNILLQVSYFVGALLDPPLVARYVSGCRKNRKSRRL